MDHNHKDTLRVEITSIVIPTTGNRLSELDRLIDSIAEQKILPLEILICGNLRNTTLDERFNYWKIKHPLLSSRLRLHFTGVKGVNTARNLGIRESRGEIILFLDDDCRMNHPEFIFEHQRLHRSHPNVTAIGGPYELSSSAGIMEAAYHWNAHYWLSKVNEDSSLPQKELLGGNFSVKSLLLGTIKFSESIVFGGAETDFVYRIQNQKHQVLWSPDLSLIHQNQLGFREFLNKSFLQGFGLGRRLLNGIQKNPENENSHLRELNQLLIDNGLSLFKRSLILSMVYFSESFFQLGIEHAYSQSRHLPVQPTFQNYLSKMSLKILGVEFVKRQFYRLKTLCNALLIIRKKSLVEPLIGSDIETIK